MAYCIVVVLLKIVSYKFSRIVIINTHNKKFFKLVIQGGWAVIVPGIEHYIFICQQHLLVRAEMAQI